MNEHVVGSLESVNKETDKDIYNGHLIKKKRYILYFYQTKLIFLTVQTDVY